ncbi:carboxymuconolactone decarboxylase family protein [Flexivirga meconopsidis]|uniref:carboxymuconolactone decarboxylase family protein n=1 Tax=Flexivirga meconopsidis TaxID=2977121 RepID=UPI0022402D7E
MYAAILGAPEDNVPEQLAARVGTMFADAAIAAAGGGSWSNPALTDRDRSIAIITALTAQGVTDERLRTHLTLARRHGVNDAAPSALMVLLASYLGFPSASQAMETVTTTRSSAGGKPPAHASGSTSPTS